MCDTKDKELEERKRMLDHAIDVASAYLDEYKQNRADIDYKIECAETELDELMRELDELHAVNLD